MTAMRLLMLWVWSSPMQAVLQGGWQRVIVVQAYIYGDVLQVLGVWATLALTGLHYYIAINKSSC